MVGLPRNIIKKYGVTKKAWQIFRSTKHTVIKYRTKHKKRIRRSRVMAKRKHSRRASVGFGGFGLGKLLTIKNVMLTVAGAALIPKVVPISPQIGGAIGGYLGSKSIIGAVAGYLLAPTINNVTTGLLSGTGATNLMNATRIY